MRAKTLVTGLCCLEDVLDALELGVEAIGFDFNPESNRYITPEVCFEILENVPFQIERVGVFKNAFAEDVIDVALLLNLNLLQFEGDETSDYCHQFSTPFVKKFHPHSENDIKILNEFQSEFYNIDLGIFSSQTDQTQSTTGYYDLARLAKNHGKIFVSGGLNEKNIDLILQTVKPYGVEVLEGIEDGPRKKSYAKMQEFVRRVQFCEY